MVALALSVANEDGGYRDVVVAIDGSVRPDQAVVEALKELLRAASRSLHVSSRGRFYLAGVTLALPLSWPRRPRTRRVPYDPWPRAHVRMVAAASLRGPQQLGDHVLLPLTALPRTPDQVAAVGDQLARVWALYRCGLIEESATAADTSCPDNSGADFAASMNISANAELRDAAPLPDKPCLQVSAWDHISCSDDFQGLRGPKNNENIHTSFQEIQQDPTMRRQLVIIFDISHSEKETGVFLRGAVASILAEAVPDGHIVTLVYFVNGSALHSGPVSVGDATRPGLANLTHHLPAQGATCTTCGLQLARQILTAVQNRSAEGSLVVLLSDGKGGRAPFAPAGNDSLAEALREAGVFVNTVAVGFSAPADLEQLSTRTEGRAFAIPDSGAVVEDGRRELAEALLDGAYRFPSPLGTDKVTYAQAPPGRSLLKLRSDSGPCAHEPVVLRVRVPQYVHEPSAALIMASLTKGLCPVVRAAARGQAFFGNDTQEFPLHDSGLGEDAYANDGIYTGQLTKFHGKGRYGIIIEMKNKSDTVFVDWTSAQVARGISAVFTESRSTGAFLETSAGQPLVVLQALKEADVRPGRVRDLTAAFHLIKNRPAVHLSWTAPGSHGFQGSVTSVDIRASRSIEIIVDSFGNATAMSDLLSRTLRPAPAFYRQQITAALPPSLLVDSFLEGTRSRIVYFALVALNEDGLRSELSNIANVLLPAIPNPRVGTEEAISEASNTFEAASSPAPADDLVPSFSLTPNTATPEAPTVEDSTSRSVFEETTFSTEVFTSFNASEAEGNETAPPAGAGNVAVNKDGQEEEDDSTTRAWILFGAFLVACLLICANLAFLYCRAQYEVDDGPPSPGSTATMTATAF
ncbi:calcium-activated chloride channel regulator 3A-1-like [Amblyomma americanum]